MYGLFSGREFSVPLWEVIIFVIIISLCLLLGKHRVGLLTSYCFVFYWGFFSNLNNFVNILDGFKWGMPLYVFSGFFMFLVALVGFFAQNRD
jgi:hypothetical protein